MVYLDKMKVLVCDAIFKEKLYIKCGATLTGPPSTSLNRHGVTMKTSQ